MWPMSNALYPGLTSPTDGRPTTSGTEQSWYTYGSRRYSASNYSRSRGGSGRRSFRTGRTGETEGGEDLRDLLRQSQQALTVLTDSDDEGEGTRSPTRGSPDYDGESTMTQNAPTRAYSWKSPIWRSLSRRTAATGRTGVTNDSVPPTPVSPIDNKGLSATQAMSRSRSRPAVRSRRIPSVASRMESEDPEPDPVPAYQEVDCHQRVSSAPPAAPEAHPPQRAFSHQLDEDFDFSFPRVAENPAPSTSSMSFTAMGDNVPGIAFSKVDYDVPTASATAATTDSPDAGHDLGPRVDPVSPLMTAEDMRDQMQPRVVTFSSFDEVAFGSITDSSRSDSRSVTNKTVDSWEGFEPDLEKPTEPVADLPGAPASTYLYGLPLIAVTAALSLAIFLVAMDVNVIATAVPHITAQFDSLDDVGWYGSAFLMTMCAFQVLFGRIYTIFPAKWTFIGAIGIFIGGSLICALSPSSLVFIIGRAVQGTGTSGIISGGLIIIAQVVPLQMRSILGAVIGAMEGVAMISAPIIGGVLTDKLNWRWCFYINLPIGGFVLFAVFFFLRIPIGNHPTPVAKRTWKETCYQLDLIGAALLVPPIVCLLLALQYGGTTYPWNSLGLILLFVLAFVLFCVFAYSQHVNAEVAMIPFRILKQRSILAGFWYILCTSSCMVIMTYFLPLWFQTIKDSTPEQSGINLLPMLIGVIVGVLTAGALVSGLGYYTPFMIAGTVLMSVGVGLLTTITPSASNAILIVYPGILGLGIGIGFQQPIIAAQTVLSKEDIPIGTSIIVFGQTIGSAIVLTLGDTVFQNRLAAEIQEYLGITVSDPDSLLTDGTTAISATLTPEQAPLLIDAANKAYTQTFYISLALAALSVLGSLLMEWKSVKKVGKEQVEEQAAADPNV